MTQYTKEELQKIYKTLPEELKEAMGSLEVLDNIDAACDRNAVAQNAVQRKRIIELVGYVLMGLLLPSDFQRTVQEEFGMEESTAKTVAVEINRFVFYPVKSALEQLHEMPAQGKPASAGEVIRPQTQPQQTETKFQEQRAQEAPQRKEDAYKEPIE